jgi:hypothetical protein
VVTVAHVVDAADLDQLHWRQRNSVLQGTGHTLPALARLVRQWIERVIKTLRSAFAAADVVQPH